MIPHQLGLTRTQAKKLALGNTVSIPYHHLGAENGEHILHLGNLNAKKLLTSYKKGKGVRIKLLPEEIHQTIMRGSGFEDFYDLVNNALKNSTVSKYAKNTARYLSGAVGNAIGSYSGNPEVGNVVSDILGSAAIDAIDSRSVETGKKKLIGDAKTKGREVGVSALEQNVGKLPKKLQRPAQEIIEEIKPRKKAVGGFGGFEGSGIKNHHYTTVKGDKVHHIGGKYIREAEAPYESESDYESGSDEEYPQVGGSLKKGSAAMRMKMAKLRAMKKSGGKINLKGVGRKIVKGLKTGAHYLIPALTSSLGATAGEIVGGPVGAIVGSAGGSYAGSQINKKLGIGLRGRGRPRKYGGDIASMTPAYKKAMRINYGLPKGVENEITGGLPISNYTINPKIRPPPTEMTLSPYQRLDSPAMNPFQPTRYTQEGGTSQGYGGRGLMGYVPNQRGYGLMGYIP